MIDKLKVTEVAKWQSRTKAMSVSVSQAPPSFLCGAVWLLLLGPVLGVTTTGLSHSFRPVILLCSEEDRAF